jgi:methylenetetrahydrofolate reductase (NADPH)
VVNIFGEGAVPVSFEVYPPRTPDKAPSLYETIRALSEVHPRFISVTFGAGGSSRRSSLEVLTYILNNTHVQPMAHLTCVGTTHAEAADVVREFMEAGISSFLALRGDPPTDEEHIGDFIGDVRSAAELVQLITHVQSERQPWTDFPVMGSTARHIDPRPAKVQVAVAAFPNGHPESGSTRADIDSLLAKQAAGADFAITQLFFHSDDYFRFVDRARTAGVEMPILPGIMPITSHQRLQRVVELTGEKEPSELSINLQIEPTAEGRAEVGVQYATNLVDELVRGGAPGIHLYAFNRHDTVLEVLNRANLVPAP